MPDKRDIHKAKSHRNSKNNKRQQAAQRASVASAAMATGESSEASQVIAGGDSSIGNSRHSKKNKSRR